MSDVEEPRSGARRIKKAKVFRTYRHASDTSLNRPTGEKAVSEGSIKYVVSIRVY